MRGVQMAEQKIAGKIDMNTGVTLAVLIAIVGAAWQGSQRLTRIEEHIGQLGAAQESNQSAMRDLVDWRRDHETWAATEATRQRAAMNELRRRADLPDLPYSGGSEFQPADRHRKPATGEPR